VDGRLDPARGCAIALVLSVLAWWFIVVILRRILELAGGHGL